MIPTRYKQMDDETWRVFGGALLLWGDREYTAMLEATCDAEKYAAELALGAAVESLARYLMVWSYERDRELDFPDAYAKAYEIVRDKYGEDLAERLGL